LEIGDKEVQGSIPCGELHGYGLIYDIHDHVQYTSHIPYMAMHILMHILYIVLYIQIIFSTKYTIFGIVYIIFGPMYVQNDRI
jgi:hypothetical protein